MPVTKVYPKVPAAALPPAKSPSRAALYAANLFLGLLLARYGQLFSDAITVPASMLVIGVFLYAAFARLRRLGEGTRLKAYIKDHEGWALVLLTAVMVAGTAFYVAYQSHLDAQMTARNAPPAHS
jgi:hypothetical protein